MPHTADTALAWVKTKINKATTDKLRGYAVLDLVSFMGVIGSHSDDEWYKSYALLQFYNTLPKEKQDAYGKKYDKAEKFSFTNGSATGARNRNKDTKPTVDKNPTALAHKNVELWGCGQCAYFADMAGNFLALPTPARGEPYPLVEKVALSNHNLVLVNGDQAGQSVIVDLWWVALGHPVADSICKLDDWGLKGQYDSEKGVSVRKIWDPTPGSAAWKDPAPRTPKR